MKEDPSLHALIVSTEYLKRHMNFCRDVWVSFIHYFRRHEYGKTRQDTCLFIGERNHQERKKYLMLKTKVVEATYIRSATEESVSLVETPTSKLHEPSTLRNRRKVITSSSRKLQVVRTMAKPSLPWGARKDDQDDYDEY